MRRLVTATLVAQFAMAAQAAQSQDSGRFLGHYLSDLHPGYTTLGRLTYIFQGYPDAVLGTQFGYKSREAMLYEKYLSELLSAPKPRQMKLHDAAILLSTRVYLDETGMQAYLVLTQDDALNLLPHFDDKELRTLSHNDRLLVGAINAYRTICLRPEDAVADWMSLKGDVGGPVEANVLALLKNLKVTTYIDRSWRPPATGR